MIVVCSNDAFWVGQCTELLGKQNEVKQLSDKNSLKDLSESAAEIVIIDLGFCGEDELPVLSIPAIALSGVPEYGQAVKLLQKGIRGYGNIHMAAVNLEQAVQAVKAGQVWLPPTILNTMITALPTHEKESGEDEFTEPLSKREEEVTYFVANGLSNKEIAGKMDISVRTVKAHLTSVFAKTGYRDRLELALNMKKK